MSQRSCHCDLNASGAKSQIIEIQSRRHYDIPASDSPSGPINSREHIFKSKARPFIRQISSPLSVSLTAASALLGTSQPLCFFSWGRGNSARPICLHQHKDLSPENNAQLSRTAHPAQSLQNNTLCRAAGCFKAAHAESRCLVQLYSSLSVGLGARWEAALVVGRTQRC